jgi:cobalamin biosynthesis protein CobC
MTIQFTTSTYDRSVFHGGDLHWVEANYGHPDQPWIDLSTGINPDPYPIPLISNEAWSRLPGALEERAMLKAAKTFYGTTQCSEICAVAGTQVSIQLLPLLFPRLQVDILTPTYAEHAICWKRSGHTVREITSLKEIKETTKVVIVVNPNNPDGNIVPKSQLFRLAKHLHSKGGFLVVDEAFADTETIHSMASKTSMAGLIVLKSFGKFFGLAGLRLGFCLGSPEIVKNLRNAIGPWSVSGISIEIATKAFSDDKWISRARQELSEKSLRLKRLLKKSGLNIAGSTSLFCLAQSDSASELFEHLCHHGIFCRNFPERSGYLRFGLPGKEDEWERFSHALECWQI